MKKIIQTTGATVVSVLLASGALVGAQSGTIDTTGPDSTNEVSHSAEVETTVENSNTVDASIDTTQDAESGEATVENTTEGGSAETGHAENENTVHAEVMIENGGSGSGDMNSIADAVMNNASSESSIERTGPDSTNTITSDSTVTTTVTNENDIAVTSNVEQTATSGDANVSDSTMGGDATSGDAHNSSSSMFSFSITN